MKKFFYIVIFLYASLSFGQKSIYESRSFNELSKTHKTLAILPFNVILHLDNEEAKGEENLTRLKEQEGYAVQNALGTFFQQKTEKKNISVRIQDPSQTNIMLMENGITYENIDIYTTRQLCELLKVEALISGDLVSNALISEGVSTDFDLLALISGKSDYGRIALKITDGKTNKLLWKYEKTITRKSGKNTNDIIEAMMKQAARKFPYEKERN